MTAREINAVTRLGKPVVAFYYAINGFKEQGRIIRARTRNGELQGLVLSTNQWHPLEKAWRAQ